MRSQHIWTEKDAEGRKREVRVTKFGGVWRFQAKYADDERWTYYDSQIARGFAQSARYHFRIYQRRRASAEDLASVGKLLSEISVDE